MAFYKNPAFVVQVKQNAFDAEYDPGAAVPHSGIYRCTGCGREIVAEEARKFPPQNHHEHPTTEGKIRWRLIVYADHKPK